MRENWRIILHTCLINASGSLCMYNGSVHALEVSLVVYLLRSLNCVQQHMGRTVEDVSRDQSASNAASGGLDVRLAAKITDSQDRTRKRRRTKSDTPQCLPTALASINPERLGASLLEKPVVSLDCEMVGISPRNISAVGRCSIVDYKGAVLFDEYIKPYGSISDYRTAWSGIRPYHLRGAVPYRDAIKTIKNILDGRIVVGHELTHDFRALGIFPPDCTRRDTARFKPLRALAGLGLNDTPSLRALSSRLLGRKIQCGPHCSVEDAQAALDIYKVVEHAWEQQLLSGNDLLFQDQFWPVDLVAGN